MVTTCLENKLLGGDEEKFTPFLLFSCLVASSGGLLFGYDLGISGGVTSTESFLKQFFPGVYTAMKQDANISNYCKFDSQLLTLFTSSLYFAGLFASLFSSQVTNRLGCRFSMRTGGAFFFAGAIIGAAAINVHMLILSRLLLGFGVGFTNQTVPLYLQEASRVLQKIRGTTDITKELDDLVAATARASSAAATQHPLRRIFRRNYRPQLVMALILPIFQQLTGINLVTYYAPTMFRSVGLEESASLLSSLITRLTATACNLVAMAFVDRFGRRKFFFFGGIQMFVSQVVVGVIMAAKLGDHGVMSREYAKLMLLFLSLYVAGFGWSWGPLPWLVSEMFPLEIRSVGQSIVVMAGFLFNAVIAQSLLLMLCHMKWGIFFFFAGWVLLMTVFVFLFLPETTGMPLERIGRVWRGHWYWKKFVESVEDKEPAEVNAM